MVLVSLGLAAIAVPALGAAPVASAAVSSNATKADAPTTTPIYDSTISPLPAHLVSEAFEATSTSEFGNKITLAPSSSALTNVVLTMDSWGCESGGWNTDNCVTTPGSTFPVPITFIIYAAGADNAVGPVLGSVTQTFNIPYRPSADDVHCTGTSAGEWYDPTTATCSHGLPTNVTFDFSSLDLVLPTSVIYGIEYNTTHYGPNPIGESAPCFTSSGGCGYDSLNVALTDDPTNVTVGSDPNPGKLYQNTSYAPNYCDGGLAGTGTFRLDSPTSACWSVSGSGAPFYTPAVQFNVPAPIPPTPPAGYWEVASDGGIFTFGDAKFFGSMGGLHLDKPVVGMAPTSDGQGYWLDASDGGIFTFGDAKFFGSTGGTPLNKPMVGMAPTPDGGGYWLVASDGGIFAYGDAQFYGSTGSLSLDAPIVGMAATPDGAGYWLVASDGGIFSFGDATFYGSMGGQHLDQPIVGMSATPDGGGYWLVASDGGIFTFGDATFYGSMGGQPLNQPIVGMTPTPGGTGYRLVASDGGIFAYGDAPYFGSMGGLPLAEPVVGMASLPG